MVSVEYVSAGHVAHALLPVTSLYIPVAHATQAVPSGPVYPVLHVQLLSSADCTAAVNVFAGHAAHACGPNQSLYVPLAH